jgi:hypothetical protein
MLPRRWCGSRPARKNLSPQGPALCPAGIHPPPRRGEGSHVHGGVSAQGRVILHLPCGACCPSGGYDDCAGGRAPITPGYQVRLTCASDAIGSQFRAIEGWATGPVESFRVSATASGHELRRPVLCCHAAAVRKGRQHCSSVSIGCYCTVPHREPLARARIEPSGAVGLARQ